VIVTLSPHSPMRVWAAAVSTADAFGVSVEALGTLRYLVTGPHPETVAQWVMGALSMVEGASASGAGGQA
jgi:hypothetical protein